MPSGWLGVYLILVIDCFPPPLWELFPCVYGANTQVPRPGSRWYVRAMGQWKAGGGKRASRMGLKIIDTRLTFYLCSILSEANEKASLGWGRNSEEPTRHFRSPRIR